MVFLSMVAAIGGFLFGYDTAVISGAVSLVTEQFDLTSIRSGWFVASALIGSIVGVLFAGRLSDVLGRKKTMIISALFFTVSAIGCALTPNFSQLIIYRIIGGIGIGVVSIVCPLYISEVAPSNYRGRMVSLYQLAITVGFLGAYLMNYFILDFSKGFSSEEPMVQKVLGNEIWRGMLGAETLPAALYLAIIFFIPESPRWLLTRGREESARIIFRKIYKDEFKTSIHIKEIKNRLKNIKGTSLSILLKPGYKRAILIGSALAILGQFMGVNAVLYYGPSIFESSGLSSGDSLFYQSLVGLVNMTATIFALFIIDKIGRKPLVYYGVSGMILSLLLIGVYFWFDVFGDQTYFLLSFFLVYIFCTAGSISAVIFVFLSEMYPTRIRGTAMSIAGFSLWVGTFLIGQLTPWMLENLFEGGTFFLFAFMCVPYLFIVWKLMPETAGKSLEEIETYWEN